MKCYLKTLTPIHIGNGRELSALDYVIINNNYYRITQKNFLQFLLQEKIELDVYSDWIIQNTENINKLSQEKKKNKNNFSKDKNQLLSNLKKNFNLLNFALKINKKNEFIDFLNSNIKPIKISIKTKQQIREFIKNALNQPYIPGTSIKGAIRTALLYDFLIKSDKNEIIKILNESIRNINPQKVEESKKEFANEIENLAFYCGYQNVNNNNSRKIFNDEKYDILKFLLISDGKITNENCLSIENVDLYLVKKNRNNYVSEVQNQPPTLETIKENCIIEFDIDFNIDYLLALKNSYNFHNSYIEFKIKDKVVEYQWINLKEKIEKVYEIDLNNLNENNKNEIREYIINNILKKVYNFSKKQIEWDKKWQEKIIKYNTSNSFDSKFLQNGFKKVSDNDLIHFGYGSGFTGITEFLCFLEDTNLKNKLKEIMDALLIGDKPGSKKTRKQDEKYNSNPDNFPKSKRLITRKDEILPLGWCSLSFEKDFSNNYIQESEDNSKKDEIYTPQYISLNKLKDGDIVDAIIVENCAPFVKFKVFIEELKEEIFTMKYFAGIPENTFVKMYISLPKNKKNISFKFFKIINNQ